MGLGKSLAQPLGKSLNTPRDGGSSVVIGTPIDAAWLLANGPAPYSLDGTFQLATNVIEDGEVFVLADDATLDLNGFDVTGCNSNSVAVSNGRFDSDLTTGWDFAGAPGATRLTSATYVNPVRASSTPNSVEWTVPASTTEYFETDFDITLVSGVEYGIGIWCSEGNEGGLNVSAGMVSEGLEGLANTNRVGTSMVNATAITGAATGRLRIQAQNPTGSPITIRIDNIVFSPRMQQVIDCGSNCTISNSGSRSVISCGTARVESNVVEVDSNFTLDGQIDLQGNADSVQVTADGYVLDAQWGSTITIRNGVRLRNDSRNIYSRDQHDGDLAYVGSKGGVCTVQNNPELAINGPQGIFYFIAFSGSTTFRLNFTGNDFGKVGCRYTNGFLVACRGIEAANTNDHVISNNTADFTGDADAFCRGIHVDGCDCTNGSFTVSGNNLILKDEAQNQEYDGVQINGGYLIQVENSKNIDITGNTLTGIGSVGNTIYRISSSSEDVTIAASESATIDMDSFPSDSDGAVFRLENQDMDEISIATGFEMTTNDRWVSIAGGCSNTLTFEQANLVYVDDGSSRDAFAREFEGSGTIRFNNPTFEDAGSIAKFKAGIVATGAGTGTLNLDGYADFTITVQDSSGTPVGSGVSVTIHDQFLTEMFSGTTDSNSQVTGSIKFFEASNSGPVASQGTSTNHEPFTLTAGGETSDGFNLTDDYTPTVQTLESSDPPVYAGHVEGSKNAGGGDFTLDVSSLSLSAGDVLVIKWFQYRSVGTMTFSQAGEFEFLGSGGKDSFYARKITGDESWLAGTLSFNSSDNNDQHRADGIKFTGAAGPLEADYELTQSWSGGYSSPITSPSIDAPYDASLLCRFFHNHREGGAMTPTPAGYTKDFEVNSTENTSLGNGECTMFSKSVDAGATGTTNFSYSQTWHDDFDIAVLAIPPASEASSLMDGLEAFWKLDEASGNPVDYMGNADLTEVGTLGSVTGHIGDARDFTGSSYGRTAKANVPDLYGGGDFTIGGWINPDTTATTQIASVYGASGNRSWLLQLGTTWRLLASTDGTATSNTGFIGSTISTGTYIHWLLQWDESENEFELFVNNVSIGTLSPPGIGLFDSTHDFNLGSRENGTGSFDGQMDATGVWSRLLTADERTTWYAAGVGVEAPF